jgi:endoglucanase
MSRIRPRTAEPSPLARIPRLTLAALLVASIVSACGGGGGGSTANAAPVPPPSTQPVTPPPSTSACTTTPTVMPFQSNSSLPFCASLTADPDGDGIGSQNGASCQMRTGFDIAADMGSGWNLGNTMDAFGNTASPLADETHWGNPKTTKANIDAVKKAGFKTMRLPVSWDDHVSGNAWTIDPQWLDRVEEIANYALANEMYVIVNIHHNNGWEAPTTANEARAADILAKLWTQIAQRFGKYDHHVIFETMNEPRVAVNGVDDWTGTPEYYAVVNRLNEAALKAIRATGGNNARRLVMLPGYVAGPHEGQVNAIVLPKDKNIALSTHAYSPYDFALNQKGTAIFNGQAELDAMFERLNKKFIQNGTPVIMGEWASTDKQNLAERVKHAAYFVRGARKAGIPTVWWDNGNMDYSATSSDIMGILDRRTNTITKPEIVDAIMCAAR